LIVNKKLSELLELEKEPYSIRRKITSAFVNYAMSKDLLDNENDVYLIEKDKKLFRIMKISKIKTN
jgi:hypothetical protein